jgi:hypothetical protein
MRLFKSQSDTDAGRGLKGPAKLILLMLAVVAGFFDHIFGGWAGLIVMATVAVTAPILLYRSYGFWAHAWFWVTSALLAIAQIPLVVFVHPIVEQSRSRYTLGFVIADGLLVIVAISVASRLSSRESQT